MSVSERLDAGVYTRRLERERKTRREAERIAEHATRRLYELNEELARSKEHLERNYAAQRDFVAIAAHELQTPTAPLVGFSTTLIERWHVLSEDDKLKFLRAIERQARRLSRLTSLLLTAARLESGSLNVHPQAVDVSQLIDSILAESTHAGDVEVCCPDGLTALADPDHLRLILSNFVDNALKYAGPPIAIDARHSKGRVEIRVCDRGPGVSEAFRPRLFERFSQADLGANPNAKGTGLGLFIVRGLARQQAGDAWYEPNHPCGACFAVGVPATDRR